MKLQVMLMWTISGLKYLISKTQIWRPDIL